MTKRSLIVLLPLLLGPVLAGCGDGSDGANDGRRTEKPIASTEVADAGATVEQYASIIARNGELRDDLDEMAGCDWLGSGSLDYDPELIVCQVGLFGLTMTSDTLAISLEGAAKEGVPAYIGAPPKEIEQLVAETIESANALTAAATAANDADCAQVGSGQCSSLRSGTMRAIANLERTIDAWAPYL